jgi:threonine/homoserine/homoserine lactone efflux protein
MAYLLNFILGALTAFIGLLPPSMLNMTAARTAMEKDTGAAVRFAVGASAIVMVQAYIAIIFTKYLATFPTIIDTLQKAALVVFLALTVLFFYQARNQQKKAGNKVKKKASDFGFGALLSTLNVLAIPFYCAVSTMLDVEGWIRMTQPFISLFVAGAAIGTFALLSVYIRFAKIIQKRAAYIARNINYILSGLSFVLFIITIIKVF